MKITERGMWIGAVAVLVLAASARGTVAGRGANIEDRLTHIEVEFGKLKNEVRDGSLSHTSFDARLKALDERVATLLPETTRWLTLAPGGTLRWEPKVGGQVYLQFVKLAAGGRSPVVHFRADPGDEVEAGIEPGEVLEVVDDRGSEKRVFRLTLLRVARSDAGPSRALFALDAERSD